MIVRNKKSAPYTGCEECGSLLLRPEHAAGILGKRTRDIYREIENGVRHFAEVDAGYCTRNGTLVGPWLGTSFAAPHVSGLAALIVSRIGRGNAAQVSAIIQSSADDRGRPGVDPYYGRGRINVAKVLGLE